MLGVALRNIRGLEIGAQQALGGTGFFDLCNHRRLPLVHLGPQGGLEVTHQDAAIGFRLHRSQRLTLFGGSNLLMLYLNNFFQNIHVFSQEK